MKLVIKEDETMGAKSKKRKAREAGLEVPEQKVPSPLADAKAGKKQRNRFYEKELGGLHVELVKLQEHIRRDGRKVVVIFEGRDAAGKGGVIKRISEPLNPRVCRVVALGTPTERQKTQWYFQRYAAELPAAGEMVLFDRSWYNRAGVERVMGFCSDADYWDFLRSVSEFERMLVRSGIVLLKYWFSVSDEVQEERFRDRVEDPTKRWKLSPMDLESRNKWQAYSQAKDRMLVHTDIEQARWYVVNSDDKKRARLNCIAHLLTQVPHRGAAPEKIKLPKRALEHRGPEYVRPPLSVQNFVPEIY
ncbi:MAG TPA: polyphosphate kinase 2 [Gammaproteobacteria bacterium]